MLLKPGRRLAVTAALLAALAVTHAAAVDGSHQDAEQLKRKIASINAFGERPSTREQRVTVSEQEINAYLTFEVRSQLPAGVAEPAVTMLGAGQVSARAVVDLDAVRGQKSRGLFDPMSFLTGRLPVTASGVLRASQGTGHLELQTATLGGVRIPTSVLQDIVSYYSRTPAHPAGVSLDDPFPLPAHIREILVEPGQTIIVQ